jgi:salicylate hydroxylase
MSTQWLPPPPEVFLRRPNDLQLKVGIVGAGIAGLSAAIALTRSGHEVEVFERSRFKNEIGAAISSCPNMTRILRHWEFDFEKTRAVQLTHVGS